MRLPKLCGSDDRFQITWCKFTEDIWDTLLPAYDAMGNVIALMTTAAATINGTSYSAGDVVTAYDGTRECGDGSTARLTRRVKSDRHRNGGRIKQYDAFGNTLRESGAYAADNSFRFSTKYHDLETGLVYYGHRYYSPSLGRFINRDPIEEQGGINLYSFVGNNGVNAYDYLGMNSSWYQWDAGTDSYYWVEGDGMDGQDHWDASIKVSNARASTAQVPVNAEGKMQQYTSFGSSSYDNIMAQTYAEWDAMDEAHDAAVQKDKETLQRIQKKLDNGKTVKVKDANGTIVVLTPSSGRAPISAAGTWTASDGVPSQGYGSPINLMPTVYGAHGGSSLTLGDKARIILGVANAANPSLLVNVIDQGIATSQLIGSAYAGVNAAINPAYGVIAGSYEAYTGMSLNPDTAGQRLTTLGRVFSGASAGLNAVSLVGIGAGSAKLMAPSLTPGTSIWGANIGWKGGEITFTVPRQKSGNQ